ncbi:MarR family transcriptional regulator [Candidatus Woesearchaeota archaeon]|nr:MarR family transcriptional regulator [Candidatus Woesearchaeota archaeon]
MRKADWALIGYIKRSKNRYRALEFLETPLIPSELGKKMEISLTHASKIIRELNEKKLISCLNEDLKVGRIYQITKQGKRIKKNLLNLTKISDKR